MIRPELRPYRETVAALVATGLGLWVFSRGGWVFWPLGALIVLYGVTLFATELLSNATVAVLITPVAVALAESLGVDPRPFLVCVMMAASAAFAVATRVLVPSSRSTCPS